MSVVLAFSFEYHCKIRGIYLISMFQSTAFIYLTEGKVVHLQPADRFLAFQHKMNWFRLPFAFPTWSHCSLQELLVPLSKEWYSETMVYYHSHYYWVIMATGSFQWMQTGYINTLNVQILRHRFIFTSQIQIYLNI